MKKRRLRIKSKALQEIVKKAEREESRKLFFEVLKRTSAQESKKK